MELKHYGIKGQKWGVRRYQNKDGSLTTYGIQRLKEAGNEYQKINKSKKESKITNKLVYSNKSLDKRYNFEKRKNVAYLLDEIGDVKMIYLIDGNAAVAKGKDWCDINLKKYFYNPKSIKITYIDK